MSIRAIEQARNNTEIPLRFIVVENSQNPYLGDYADELVWTPEKHPFAVNVNRGLKAVDTPYFVMLSNDVFVPQGWLEELYKVMELPNCGVATLLSSQFNIPPSDTTERAFFGAIWMTKKDIIDKVGHLDERFVNSFEDADLWVRMAKAGYDLYRSNRILVEHLVGATAYELASHKPNYRANRKLFNEKHDGCGLQIFEALR